MYRKTYVEIDCKKLEDNIKNITSTFKDYKYYFGVVKANAYSHGIELIKYLISSGINYLAVSSLEEALEVRSIDKNIPVLVMEPISFEAVQFASKNDITVTIDDIQLFDKLLKENIKIKFHIKIDTGMNRFGTKSAEDVEYMFNNANDNLFLEGIFTHLASGVGEIYDRQIAAFKKITSRIDLEKIPIVHLDRSLTMEQHEKLPFANGVRLGIVMYGYKKENYTPSWKRRLLNFFLGRKCKVNQSKLSLEKIFTLKSQVIEIKDVSSNENIGYSGMSSTHSSSKIAIIPVGFGDFSYISPKEYVYIKDKKYEIIVVNMDVCIVKIDDNVCIGDEVEFIGNNIEAKTLSNIWNINAYKVLLSVTDRVPRIYKYGDKEYEIKYRRVEK